MKVSMMCVGGPYAGQTVKAPWPDYRFSPEKGYQGPCTYLVNIWDGSALHCYLTVSNGEYKGWRLDYQETF